MIPLLYYPITGVWLCWDILRFKLVDWKPEEDY